MALLRANGITIVNNSFERTAPGDRPTGLAFSGDNVLAATNRFSNMETGIVLFGNDPEFLTSPGIASNAVLTANGFCNVVTKFHVWMIVLVAFFRINKWTHNERRHFERVQARL